MSKLPIELEVLVDELTTCTNEFIEAVGDIANTDTLGLYCAIDIVRIMTKRVKEFKAQKENEA